MNKSEAYWNGYDDAMNNYLSEHYKGRGLQFSGYAGNPPQYEDGYKDGWNEADRIDALVE